MSVICLRGSYFLPSLFSFLFIRAFLLQNYSLLAKLETSVCGSHFFVQTFDFLVPWNGKRAALGARDAFLFLFLTTLTKFALSFLLEGT